MHKRIIMKTGFAEVQQIHIRIIKNWTNLNWNNSFVNPQWLPWSVVRNFWNHVPSTTRCYSKLAGRWNLEIFKIDQLQIKLFDCSLHLTKKQHYHRSTNAFKLVFSTKAFCKMGLKVQKIWKPYIFIVIPTIKYYCT